jgi:CubicO group peptidase (beta-lactamase class C family)
MKKIISFILSLSFLILLSLTVNGQYVARHNMSSYEYQGAFNTYVGAQKMRLADLSVYNKGGKETYAAIWDKKSSPGWLGRHAMSEAGYQAEVTTQKNAGYRPGRITAADISGKVVFACIFYKTSVAWEARHNMSSQQYQTEYNNWVGKGYRLAEVCGYKRNGQETYAAVWEKSAGPLYIARHAMNAQQYQAEFNTQYGNGYKPVRVSAFEAGGQSRFAAIFEKMNDGVYARSGLNEHNYQAEFDNGWYLSSALKHVCGYNVNGTVYFSALWMGAGLGGNDQNLINNKVKKYMDDFNVPGLSIAVMKDGKLVFARGYGQADKSNGNMVSPNSLFRIASVSKPITSSAIMRLTETTNLKLGDKLFGPGGILGDLCAGNNNCIDKTDAEKITVQSCLEHSTGWTNDAVWDQYQLNNSDITKWALKNYSQGTAPGANYKYINFDFFLLGRVIEKKSGQTYENYVKSVILAKCGVTKMRIGSDNASGKAPNEVTYYSDNTGDPYALKLTRMDANGGWIARPIDLLMFATGIDGLNNRPDVISAGTITTMRTISMASGAGNYAKGLIVNGDWWKHNGCMPGTLGELCHFSNGITVAILINTRPNNDQCTGNGLYPLINDIAGSAVAWPAYDLF